MSLSLGNFAQGQALSVSGRWVRMDSLSGDHCAKTLTVQLNGRDVVVSDKTGELWKFLESENWSSEEGSRYLIWRKYPSVFEVFEERRVSKPEFETTKIRFERRDSTLAVMFERQFMMQLTKEKCLFIQQ